MIFLKLLPLLKTKTFKYIALGLAFVAMITIGIWYVKNHNNTIVKLARAEAQVSEQKAAMEQIKQEHTLELEMWEAKYASVVFTVERRKKEQEELRNKIKTLEDFRDSTPKESSPVLKHTFELLKQIERGDIDEIPE